MNRRFGDGGPFAARYFLAAASVVLALNFAWEMGQARWFASMHNLPFWQATYLCFRASLGDLAATVVAYLGAAAAARNMVWPLRSGSPGSKVVFIVVGVVIASVYELFALKSGRWSYDSRMPTIDGLGLLPLLQWLVLPAIEIGLASLARRRSAARAWV